MKEKALTIEDQQKPKSEELFRVIEVENTPFSVIERTHDSTGEVEYHVVIGKYRLNKELFLFEDDAIEWAKEINWEKILQVIGIVTENWNEKNLNLNN